MYRNAAKAQAWENPHLIGLIPKYGVVVSRSAIDR
jgi:hypothetical protein